MSDSITGTAKSGSINMDKSFNENGMDVNKIDSLINETNNKQNQNQKPEEKVVDLLDFDMLKLYFGLPYKVNDYITINVPTIGDIIEFGESNFWGSITPFTGNATTYRVVLWDAGIDWNNISDFELFIMLSRSLTPQITGLLFGDFDFSKLLPMKRVDTDEIILCNPETMETVLDEITYIRLTKYIRTMLNQHPKNQFAKGKTTKEMIIRREKEKIAKASKNVSSSSLLPLVSALVNHAGFKYKTSELKEVNIVEFMDSVNRLQVYEQTTAFLKGMYSGFMDTSKMSQEQLNKSINWLRDIHNEQDE